MSRGRILRIAGFLAVLALTGGIGLAEQESAPRPEERGAWLGVWLSDAVDGGAQINAVVGNGPADAAGLKSGDVVFEAGGRPVGDEDGLGRVLREMAPGEALKLKVWRAGRSVELSAVLASRQARRVIRAPDPPRAPDAWPRLMTVDSGLSVSEITPGLREHFGAPQGAGILVTRIEPGRPAEKAGLHVGDVLVRVGDAEIRNERDLRVNLIRCAGKQSFEVEVIRGREPTKMTVHPSQVKSISAATSAQETRVRRLEIEIESLERRLDELRGELERAIERD